MSQDLLRMPRIASKRRLARRQLYKFAPFKWKEEKPLNLSISCPRERSGHRIIYYNGSIYAFGGYNPSLDGDVEMMNDNNWLASKPLFKELWKFNTFTKKWKKMPLHGNVPSQLASHTTTLVDIRGQTPKLMVYGGTGAPYGVITSSSIFVLDLHTFRWEVLEVGNSYPSDGLPVNDPVPPALYGQAVLLDKSSDDFYTVGGTSGYSYYIDIHKINMKEKLWECIFKAKREDPVANEPSPRYRHELAFYKNKLYILGGGTSIEADGFDYLHAFDLQTKSWNIVRTHPDPTIPIDEGILEQFPSARRCHGVAQHEHYVFLIGGYDGLQIFEETWRLNLDTMEWRKLPFNLPQPVYFNATAISPGGKIFSFGGVTDIEKNTRSKSVYSCWSTIPSLRDMCWEAVNHYNPHLETHPVEDLVKEGVPLDLLDTVRGEPHSVG